MVLPFCFPATLILRIADPEEGEEPSGGNCPPPDSDRFNGLLGKIGLARRDKSLKQNLIYTPAKYWRDDLSLH